MELENNTIKQTYIQLLSEVSVKKLEILKQLMTITKEQEAIIIGEPFEEDKFLGTITLKEEQLLQLNGLDTGFEQIYASVKEELRESKYKYAGQIAELKEYIASITDMSVQLQALEQRNKSKLDKLLVRKRKEIKSSRIGLQSAAQIL